MKKRDNSRIGIPRGRSNLGIRLLAYIFTFYQNACLPYYTKQQMRECGIKALGMVSQSRHLLYWQNLTFWNAGGLELSGGHWHSSSYLPATRSPWWLCLDHSMLLEQHAEASMNKKDLSFWVFLPKDKTFML